MKHFMIALIGLFFATTVAHAQSGYRIQPGDTLTVEVLEDTTLNRSLLVLPDGSVNFPFAGRVRASGQTAAQVQRSITNGIASNFAADPTVFVTVSSLRPKEPTLPTEPEAPETINVYFTGEVSSAGLKEVEPGTTFLQAIAQSGGFSNFAATKRIQLRRTDRHTGRVSTTIINYRALSRGAILSKEIYMQDGDVILVPERRLFE